jgi:hypothetical protein
MVNKKAELKLAIACFILAAAAALFIGCPVLLPPPPPPPATVTLDVCPASGLLPNPYCPVTEKRTYEKGNEPTTQCGVHQAPPPPPPVEPDPQAPFIGTSFYQLMTAPLEDIKWFIDGVKEAGGNATELFLNFTWADGWRVQPFKIVKWDWHDDAFPGVDFPLFDLDQQDPVIWAKLRAIFDYCHEKRIAIFIRIQDFCSLKDPLEKRYYVFRSNKQRLLDGTFTGGIWGEPGKKWYSIQNARLLEELKASGVVYFLQPMNEADYLADPGDSEELKNQKVIDFHKFYRDDLISQGVPPSQLVASVSRAYSQIKALGFIMEIHGINSPRALQEAHTAFGKDQIFFNGDGPDQYAEGRAGDKPMKREPSLAQGAAMGAYIKQFGLWAYCYFNRATEQSGSNIRAAQFDVLASIARAVK